MTSRLLHRAACLAAALAFLAAPSVTHADPYTIVGTTQGIFTNAQGGSATSGELTNEFKWGKPTLNQSSLLYTGSSINTVTGTPFKLGTLKFHNGLIDPDTDIQSVDLTVNLELTEPHTNESLGTDTLTVSRIFFDTTGVVSLPTSFAPLAFTVDNVNYTLALHGFWESFLDFPYPTSQLTAFLGTNDSASLWGTITAEAVPVPEPASIAVVAIAGLFGLGHAIRRRRSAASA